jgi:hypothetical protein
VVRVATPPIDVMLDGGDQLLFSTLELSYPAEVKQLKRLALVVHITSLQKL